MSLFDNDHGQGEISYNLFKPEKKKNRKWSPIVSFKINKKKTLTKLWERYTTSIST